MRRPRPELTGQKMRQYLGEVGARLAARGYSPGELPRDVQILLESVFE